MNSNTPANVFGRHLAKRAPLFGGLTLVTFALEAAALGFGIGDGVRTTFAFFADDGFWATPIVSMYVGIGAVAEAAAAAAERNTG